MSEENGCGCGCGCDSKKENETEENENLTTVLFKMDNEFLAEINKAAEVNGMEFQDFVLNSIEVGLALTAGQVALMDPETGKPFGEEAE